LSPKGPLLSLCSPTGKVNRVRENFVFRDSSLIGSSSFLRKDVGTSKKPVAPKFLVTIAAITMGKRERALRLSGWKVSDGPAQPIDLYLRSSSNGRGTQSSVNM